MISIEKIYKNILHKYRRSFYIYISMSIISFVLSAVIVILNLFAIRYNPGSQESSGNLRVEYIMFVAIALITTIQGFVAGILSLFTWKTKIASLRTKNEQIESEIKLYKLSKDDYNNEKTKKSLFIRKIRNILNSNN